MQITFARLDGRTYGYTCRTAADAAQQLLVDVLPEFRAQMDAKGKTLLNAKLVADPAGTWVETRRLGNMVEARTMKMLLTSEPKRAAAISLAAKQIPSGLTPRQQDEWRYDQGANEGGEGYNPHRQGSAHTYR